jgi:hypothetical protein
MRQGTGVGVGVGAGIVLMLLVQGRETAAHAAPPQSVDNQGKYTLAVGSSEPNRHDMMWVLHEHAPHPKLRSERGDDAGLTKPTQITLCLYKIEKQGELMKLVAARDIAYDIEFQNLGQAQPDAKFVYKHFKDLADEKKK